MKSKKLISLLCAAAMTISSFAGLTLTASADNDAVAVTPTAGTKTVTVKTEGTTAQSGVLLHAVYAGGKLVSVEAQPLPDVSTEDKDVVFTKADYTAYESQTGSKLMAWNSLTGMVPYTVTIVPSGAEPAVHTVTLNTNGGTINSGNVTSYTEGTAATLPTDVTKDYYDFDGWYDNNGLTGSAVTEIAATETTNKEYWAKWTAKTYSITYNMNGHGTQIATDSYTYGTAKALETPENVNGFTFGGWYDNADGTGDPVTITAETHGNIEVYAKWTAVATHTVTFDTGADGSAVAPQQVADGSTASQPENPTRNGFTFVKWQKDGVDYVFTTPVTGDITLVAVWQANSSSDTEYTVTFDSDGGSAVASQTVKSGNQVSKPADPTKDNYTFVKWQLDGVDYVFTTPVTGDITLKAVWQQNSLNQYTVTFDSDGGSTVASQTVTSGQTAVKPADPTREGYTFVKWQLNGSDYSFSTLVTGDITLTAVWKVNTPSITIDYVNEVLEGFGTGSYTIDGTDVTTRILNNTIPIDTVGASYFGKTIKIVKKGTAPNLDSDEFSLSVPARHIAPTSSDITITQPTAIGGSGKISGVTDAMEYRKNSETTYTPGDGNDITAAVGDTYYVRYKAVADTSFKSEDYQVPAIVEYSGTKEATPAIDINYTSEMLTGFTADAEYTITVDGTSADITPSGTSISATDYIGKTISIVKKGNGTTTANSDAQSLDVPARPTIPSTIKIDNATESVSLPAGYSYGSTNAVSDGTTSGARDIKVDPEASLYIQLNATNSAFKSDVKALTAPARAAAPTVAVKSYTDETLDTTTAIQYLDGENWVDCTDDMPITTAAFGYGTGEASKAVSFRTKATEDNYASEGASFTIPARPAAPTGLGSTPESNSTAQDGTIIGVDDTMEYKSGSTWTAVGTDATTVTGLAAGSYSVRKKATDSAFAGLEANVDITREGSHTIKFVDYNGDTIDTQVLENGATVTAPADPTREQDEYYSYEFSGWTPTVATTVAGDATYTATYSQTAREYTVTLNLGEGTWTDETKKITTYTYSPSAAVTLPTEGMSYAGHSFAGWKNLAGDTVTEIAAGTTGNRTYTAQWSTNTYTITWSIDGTTTTEANVSYGTQLSHDNPTKEGNAQYSYTFLGWSEKNAEDEEGASTELPTATKTTTYYAVFSQTVNKYTVTWKSQDGSDTIETDENVEYGAAPSFDGTAPTKDATAQQTFTFAGWATEANQTEGTAVGELSTVSGNVTYYAAFSAAARTYTIKWVDEDGTTELEVDNDVAYGATPSYGGETPTKAATDTHTYTFKEWTPAIVSVEGDKTYKATYTETPKTFNITYTINGHGTQPTENTSYTYGTTVTLPTLEETGYTFGGWYDGEDFETANKVEAISATDFGDKTFYAKWTINSFDVKFMNGDTQVGDTQSIDYNGTATVPETDPEKTGYTFVGWNTDATATTAIAKETIEAAKVTAAVTYNAIWTPVTYTITYMEGEAEVHPSEFPTSFTIESEAIAAPTTAGYTKEGYTFEGWYDDASLETAATAIAAGSHANKTYYAKWTQDIANHTVTFSAGTDGTLTGDATEEVADGGNVTKVPTASKTDYTFAGWSDGTNTYADADAVKAVTISDDIIFTATYVTNFVSAVDGKVKAISLLGTDSSEASQADKTYAQLKIAKAVTPVITRSSSGVVSEIGGKTTYADEIILASSATVGTGVTGTGPVAVVKIDVTDYVAAAAAGRVRLSFDTIVTTGTYNSNMTVAKINNPSKDIGALTFADLAGVTLGTGTDIGATGRGAIANLHYDIEDDIAALNESDDKVLYYVFHVANSREAKISNFAITTTPLYTVTATADENGSLTASVDGKEITSTTKLEEGTEVTLTPSAGVGYQFKEYKATPNDLTITDNKFSMPSGNVTVKAIFEEKAGVPASLTIKYTSDGTSSGTEYASVEVFDTTANKMVGETVEAADLAEYKNPVKSAVTSGTFRVYDVDANALTSDITLTDDNEAANVVYAKATDRGHDYYFYEDYESYTAAEGATDADGTVSEAIWEKLPAANTRNYHWQASTTDRYNAVIVTQSETSNKLLGLVRKSGGNGSSGLTYSTDSLTSSTEYSTAEFDLRIKGAYDSSGADRHSILTISAQGGSCIVLEQGSLAQKASGKRGGSEIWTINNQTEVTLAAAKYYHFKIVEHKDFVIVSVADTEGTEVLAPTVFYTSDSVKSNGFKSFSLETNRYNVYMYMDNIEIYKRDANAQTLGSIGLDGSGIQENIITSAETQNVGKLVVTQKDKDGNAMRDWDDFTYEIENSPAGITVAKDGTITITSAAEAGEYNITAKSGTVTSNAYKLVISGVSQTLGSLEFDTTEMNSTGASQVILTTTRDKKSVGQLSVIQKDTEGTLMVTPAAVTYAVENNPAGVSVDENGNVSITKDAQAGSYNITATAGSVTTTTPYVLNVAATGAEEIRRLTDDFDEAEGVTSRVFDLKTTSSMDSAGRWSYSNIKERIAVSGVGTISETLDEAIYAEEGKPITLSFDAYAGNFNSYDGAIKIMSNGTDTPLLEIHNAKSSWNMINEIKINGVTPAEFTESFRFFNCLTGKNLNTLTQLEISTFGKPHVEVTVNSDKTVTVKMYLVKDGVKYTGTSAIDKTFTGTAANASISGISLSNTGAPKNTDRHTAIDNIVTTLGTAE